MPPSLPPQRPSYLPRPGWDALFSHASGGVARIVRDHTASSLAVLAATGTIAWFVPGGWDDLWKAALGVAVLPGVAFLYCLARAPSQLLAARDDELARLKRETISPARTSDVAHSSEARSVLADVQTILEHQLRLAHELHAGGRVPHASEVERLQHEMRRVGLACLSASGRSKMDISRTATPDDVLVQIRTLLPEDIRTHCDIRAEMQRAGIDPPPVNPARSPGERLNELRAEIDRLTPTRDVVSLGEAEQLVADIQSMLEARLIQPAARKWGVHFELRVRDHLVVARGIKEHMPGATTDTCLGVAKAARAWLPELRRRITEDDMRLDG